VNVPQEVLDRISIPAPETLPEENQRYIDQLVWVGRVSDDECNRLREIIARMETYRERAKRQIERNLGFRGGRAPPAFDS
jgi:hypothetical protein